MTKRCIAAILSLCLLLACAIPARGTETEETEQESKQILSISTAKQFLTFAENCRLDSYSQGLTVELKRDIDLTGMDFSGIPIFCGSFLGNGHTISGVMLDGSGSQQGFFRYLTDTAVVRQLHVHALVKPAGSHNTVGGIVGENSGRVEESTFSGEMIAGEIVGGIAGVNTVSGVIEQCRVSGSITGNHFLGGIAGENAGVIRNCENTADINTTPQQNQVSLADITLDTLTDTEAAVTVTDMGGIAGTSTGVIRGCTNWGTMGYNHMGYNIGGIVGSQSGSVLDCQNHGTIWGRKEVGGIVGHLEPSAVIEFDEDALQILKKQISALGSTVNQTAANIQYSASSLYGQINQMGSAVENAWDSVSMLVPDWEDPELPDWDTIEAARNGLSDSLWSVSSSLEGISYATQGAMSALSANMFTLQQQVAAMSVTLGNASETLGGTIEDVSDLDTEQDLSGKVAGCINRGDVHADLNAGGIAGAMAMESDLNAASNLETLGERSLNFTSRIRCVVLSCENMGGVTAGKQQMGGITGYQTVGLIRQCDNIGDIGSENAKYVGGVAGRSSGYIRSSSSKCILTGDSYIGGIAGSGAVVTDCRSIVQISSGREKTGAVLGISDAPLTQSEDPIRDNLYCAQNADYGGIDGVSYQGKAEGKQQKEFFALEELSDIFQTVTITFRGADGSERTRRVRPGGELPPERIPPVPVVDGKEGEWKGLEEAELSNILFDMTFEAQYTSPVLTVASGLTRGEKPVLLLQGEFEETATVEISQSQQQPVLPEDYRLSEAWDFALSGAKTVTDGRVLIPEGEEAGSWHVLVCLADGSWQERSAQEHGSYLVFSMDGTETAIAVAATEPATWYWYAIGGGVLLGIVLILLLVKKRKK